MTDLQNRLSFTIDPEAESSDWDQALVQFLLRMVRESSSGKTSPAENDFFWGLKEF